MQRVFFLGVAVFAAAAAFAWQNRRATPAVGMLKAEKPSIEILRTPPLRAVSTTEMEARFRLVNTGGTPVTIESVDSDCGCAKPRVEPSVIEPGREGYVIVSAVPPSVGERRLSITLNTDSPATPRIPLTLQLMSSRRPPYLLGFTGELAYPDIVEGETRDVIVETVELKEEGLGPRPTSDLPWLRFVLVKKDERAQSPGSDVFHRYYTFRVEIASMPTEDEFRGLATVTDPWDSGNVLKINVLGRKTPEVKVAPSRGRLRAGGHPGETAKFLILTKDHKEEIRVETELQDSPLVVERFGEGEVDRPIRFDVHLKAGQGGPGEVHNVVIRRSGTSAEPIKVPISIQ